MGVPDFGEGQVENKAKCGKIDNFPGLKQGLFQVVPDISEHSTCILHLFWPNSSPPPLKCQKTPKSFKRTVFLDKFQTFPLFFTLSLFSDKVSNFIMPSYPVIIEVT